MENRKFSNPLIVHPVASLYTDCAIPAPKSVWQQIKANYKYALRNEKYFNTEDVNRYTQSEYTRTITAND
jgi:hypothetical protein